MFCLSCTADPDRAPAAQKSLNPCATLAPDFRSLSDLDAALRTGAETVSDRVAVTRERIELLDRQCYALRSVLHWNAEASRIAQRQDEALADRGRDGGRFAGQPLLGVPVLLKASIDTGDEQPTHAGAFALATRRAADDAVIAAALRRAGAVIVGKANLSEWANFRSERSVSGWSSMGGQTRNPHVLDRNPCGSSSGSAVAVAAGLVPVAIGTETNGSIMCPAGVNGVVGFKPTQARVSADGIVPIAASHDVAGPFGRSVADVARVAAVLLENGQSLLDGLSPDALQGARVAVWRGHTGAGSDPRLEAILERALAALSAAGATLIDPLGYELDPAIGQASFAVLKHEFHVGLADYLAQPDRFAGPSTLAEIVAFNEAHPEQTMPWFGQDLLTATLREGRLSDADHRAALAASRDRLREELAALRRTHRFDAIVSLTNAPAWPIDAVSGDRFSIGSSSLAAISGWPTLTLPAGTVSRLPVGVSLTAPAGEDEALLAMAQDLEARLPPAPRPAFQPTLEAGAATQPQVF
ncbi:MAG: amidase family protein [Pseudomonadota bacterium]